MSNNEFQIKAGEDSLRLDLVIVILEPAISRKQARSLINAGKVFIDGKVEYRPQYKVREQQILKIEEIPAAEDAPDIIAQNIPVDIIYEDNDLIVVNKPSGMVTHPATGNWTGTLLNALLFHFSSLRKVGEAHRSGLIHRLDKDTSGLVLVGKTSKGLWYYSRLFAERKIEKIYLAIIVGRIGEEFPDNNKQIINYLGRNPKQRKKIAAIEPGKGKFAETRIQIVKRFRFQNNDAALIKIEPKTGRTHQIRVHLSGIGCGILGDKLYGKHHSFPRLLLHAWKLKLTGLDGNIQEFVAPIPKEFKDLANVENLH